MSKKRLLIVAAHPDDEILGCGGTVARMVKNGYEAFTLILGEGKTSRSLERKRHNHSDELKGLIKEIKEANSIIGVKETFIEQFPDNRFDQVDLLDIVKKVETIKQSIKPEVIFTHFRSDLNIDHQLTYDAVLTATRPLPGETVKEIFSFEILSSTEWRFPLTFSPNIFFDISETLSIKVQAMNAYQSELCPYPHPRSIKGIEAAAHYWGMRVGIQSAETFEVVRSIK